MSQSKILRETIFMKLKEKYFAHPFVKELCNNTLPPSKARFFALQNYSTFGRYIQFLVKLESLTNDSKEIEELKKYQKLMEQQKSETESAYTKMFGISIEELKSIKSIPVRDAYAYRMLNLKTFAETIAFLIPGHIVMECVGKCLIEIGFNDPLFANGFKLWTEIGKWFEMILDQRMGSASKEDIEEIKHEYTLGCNYEFLYVDGLELEQKWPFGDIKVC